MSQVIDQRSDDYEGKDRVSRERFNQHHHEIIKKAVEDALGGSIGDIAGNDPKVVSLPNVLVLPHPSLDGNSGTTETVFPGNTLFHKGDKISRKSIEGGAGGGGGGKGGSTDVVIKYVLTDEEWIRFAFGGLELPDMVVKTLTNSTEFDWKRHGYSTFSPQQQLDVKKTVMRADGRMSILEDEIEEEIALLLKKVEALRAALSPEDSAELVEVLLKIKELEAEFADIPEFDSTDQRYRRFQKVPVPITMAWMCCIMDVSGSTTEWHKKIALKFFQFEYKFLTTQYQKVVIVLIHHESTAYECETWEEFCTILKTGGTEFSKALVLHKKIQEERFPVTAYNAYVSYASDGDNEANDCNIVKRIMETYTLDTVQYFAYVQVDQHPHENLSLWKLFSSMQKTFGNLAISHLNNEKDIFPVFRKLFKKKGLEV